MKSLTVILGGPFQDIERSRHLNSISKINVINHDLDKLDRRSREGQNSKYKNIVRLINDITDMLKLKAIMFTCTGIL